METKETDVNKEYQFEVSNEEGMWEPFRVKVVNGLITWCSDNSHPIGASWAALKHYYGQRTGSMACIVKEVTEYD